MAGSKRNGEQFDYVFDSGVKKEIKAVLHKNITEDEPLDFDKLADKIGELIRDIWELKCDNVEEPCPFVKYVILKK